MQEGSDGCKISQIYLQMVACLQYLERLEFNLEDIRRVSTTLERIAKKSSGSGSLNDSIQEDDYDKCDHDQSILGLSDIMEVAQL